MSSITERTAVKQQQPEQQEEAKTEVVKEESMEIDAAWQQATRYQEMTLREKEDIMGGPAFMKQEPGRYPRSSSSKVSINPMFYRRRNDTEEQPSTTTTTPRYPDPSVAVPYLALSPPTIEQKKQQEKEQMEKLGPPGSLLWMYWTTKQVLRQGKRDSIDDYDGKEIIRSQKDGKWRRLQKELDGRMPQNNNNNNTANG